MIYLFQSGAPSQVDLFDYKPKMKDWYDKDLPDSIRQGQRLTTMTSGYRAVGDTTTGTYKHGPSSTPFQPDALSLYGNEEGWHRDLLKTFLAHIGGEVRPMGTVTSTFYRLYARAERMETDRSILDWVRDEMSGLRRDLGPDLMARLTRLVRETVRYSLDHRADALAYAMEFARGLDPAVADRYWIMRCGASMGIGYGPILVARPGGPASLEALAGTRVAIPGLLTTAYLVARLVRDRVDGQSLAVIVVYLAGVAILFTLK